MDRRRAVLLTTTLAVFSAASACFQPTVVPEAVAAPRPAVGAIAPGPDAPARGLPIPRMDQRWTPPQRTAGDLAGLAAALRGADVTVILDPTVAAPQAAARLQSIARQYSGRPASGRNAGDVLHPPLNPVRVSVPGPPRYDATGLRVDLAAIPETAAWVVDDPAIDLAAWNALPAATVGTCDPPLLALARGQEQSLALLEPFLDHADAALGRAYADAVAAAVPPMLATLRPDKRAQPRSQFATQHDYERHRCRHDAWTLVRAVASCPKPGAPCPTAPRMFLVGALRIGSAQPPAGGPGPRCAGVLGVDYVAKVRAVAHTAVTAVRDQLDPQWLALADRLGAITEVHAALEDVCAPRRRRFDPRDLEAARARLQRIGQTLATHEPARPDAGWATTRDSFHVPGIGAVHQLARYQSGPGSAAQRVVAGARALRRFVLGRARCRAEATEPPLATAVVRDGEVAFFGYVYEEELWCGDLGPRLNPSSDVSAAR